MLVKDVGMTYQSYAIDMRRKFHQCPEMSLEEYATCKMIVSELESIGLNPRIVADTGVIVDICGSLPGKTVAIRADIDALPIFEQTDVPYRSKNDGFMHACGHDAHIAMNLACARILSDIKGIIRGRVRLIFQPGEEIFRGAGKMIAAGALEGVDTIYVTHVWSDIPAGIFSVEEGPRMASADFFTVHVKGKSCHGSEPHQGVDAIAAASAAILNLQTVVSRETAPLEPVVVSVCQFHAGSANNVIAEKAVFSGTTRTYSRKIRDDFPPMLQRICRSTGEAFRAEIDFKYSLGSSPVINDPACSKLARAAVVKNFGENSVAVFEKVMGGEDFAQYLDLVPGVFVFLGVRSEEKHAVYPQHSNRYAIDEDALIRGAVAAAQYAVDYLDSNTCGE